MTTDDDVTGRAGDTGRFATRADRPAALRGASAAAGKPAMPRPADGPWRVVVAWSALAAMLAVAGAVGSSRAPAAGTAVASPAGPLHPTAIAIPGFRNLSGSADVEWMSTGLAEMLDSDLSRTDGIRTISGDTVARMKRELALADADSFAPDTLARIGANLDTDLVVVGSYRAQGGSLRLDLRVQDVATGGTRAVVTADGTDAEILELVARSGRELREKLGIAATSHDERAPGHAWVSRDPEAVKLYLQGVARERALDWLGARGLYEAAVARDPESAAATAALAQALSRLGYVEKAGVIGKRAIALVATAPTPDRLVVEARVYAAATAWDETAARSQALFDRDHTDLEVGISLADAQIRGDHPSEAALTIAALRSIPGPVASDPRIDLEDARVALKVTDYRLAVDLATRAAADARSRGATTVVADALLVQCAALPHLGDLDAAETAAHDAEVALSAIGDRLGASDAVAQRAVVVARRGDFARALVLDRSALETASEMGSRYRVAVRTGNVEVAEVALGNLAEARTLEEIQLATYRDIGDREGEGGALLEACELDRNLGDLAGAERACTDAAALLRESTDQDLLSGLAQLRGDLLYERDDLDGARAAYQAALEAREAIGWRGGGVESTGSLALVATEQGRFDDAERLARNAIEPSSFPQLSQWGYVALAEALLARGKLGPARDAVAHTETGQAVQAQFVIDLARARVQLASGDGDGARRKLTELVDTTTRAERLEEAFEARLTLGQAEPGAAGRARLDALTREASAHGFARIARKARAARARK